MNHALALVPAWIAAGVSPLDWAGSLPASLATNGVAVLIGLTVGWLYRKASNQRIWSISNESKVVVFVAESARQVVQKKRAMSKEGDNPPAEVSYVRSATGVGQVRALAAIAPSLRVAYRRLDLEKIRMASEGLGGDQKCDVISLGGVKNSPKVTGAILNELSRRFELRGSSHEDWLAWVDDDGQKLCYEAEGQSYEKKDPDTGELTNDREIRHDFGLIVKAPNPWNPKSTVIVFAGASTYGTTAAANFFVSQRRWSRPKHFEALVEVGVAAGHSGEPECLHLESLKRRSAK